MSRTSRTLIYAPEVRINIQAKNGKVYDISEDIVQGQVRRITNGVSTFSCILNNRKNKYMGLFTPMDKVTIFMKRIGNPIQVFAGYLDRVPVIGLYVNTVSISGSCSLKRIQNTYWDPYLPESVELLNQLNYTGGGAHDTDAGMGKMLGDVLFKVGGWYRDNIKIQNIPSGFLNLAFDLASLEKADAAAIARYKRLLGLPDSTPTTTGGSTPGSTKPTTKTIPTKASYTIDELVSVFRQAGFKGDSLVEIVSISMSLTKGKNTQPYNGVDGNGNSVRRLGILLFNSKDQGTGLSEKDYLNPNKTADHAYSITKGGTIFSYWSYLLATANRTGHGEGNYTAQAKAAVLKQDSNALSNTGTTIQNPSGVSGGSVNEAQKYSTVASTASDNTSSTTSESTAGSTNYKVPKYDGNASQSYLQGIYGNSEAAVKANLVTISFMGNTVQVHKYAAAAFKAVNDQLTTLATGYQIKEIGTFEYRAMNNGTGTSTLSWHSYGIAIDINPSTNGFVAAGIGNGTHDMPDSWIATFRANGFQWGGDWGDYMHFQWEGGGTFTGNTGNVPSSSGNPSGTSLTNSNAFEQGVFNYLYLGIPDGAQMALSVSLEGDKAPVNDVSLLPTVQSIASSSLRSFMSGPNGDFIAFYPDYFGISGSKPKLILEDIEMIDFSMNFSDDSLVTDLFVAGGTNQEPGGESIGIGQWLASEGVATIRQKETMALALGIDIHSDPDFKYQNIYSRYGMRPLKAEFPQLSSHIAEKLQAVFLFQQKWAEQYSTTVSFTFMPELYPGMRILVKSHAITVYVQEVVHTFGYDTGFQTSATISAPASAAGGGLKGLPVAKI